MAKTSNGVTTEYTTDLSSGYSQVLKAKTGTNAVYYTRGFELISKQEGSSAAYYLYDGGLSVRALTNESGSVTDTLVFDAFGNETAKTGSTDNSYGFQGEEKDETGLYYLRARYMDPATGTFTSMDTYGGSLTDPMSLHKYLFANSNPVAYCDPSGHSSFTLIDAISVCAIIGALSGAILYKVGFLRDESQPESILGYIEYEIIGAIIGALICLIVYAIVFMYYIILAYLLPGSELLKQQLNKGNITLSTSQYARAYHASNAIQDHLTFSDFTGAIRDLMGHPAVSQSGKVWNHIDEVTKGIQPVMQAVSSISKMLNNPNLSPDAREFLTYTQSVCTQYVEYFNKIMERFG